MPVGRAGEGRVPRSKPPHSGPGPTSSSETGSRLPERIVVPTLSVNAPVVPITASGGTLLPPSSPSMIGWWSDGARPGAQTGTAILTGHTVSSGGGAFDDLDQMQTGQRVHVVNGRRSIEYVVSSVTIYSKQSLAEDAAEIFDQGISGRLALVTCEDWDGTDYLSNAVIIAEPVAATG